MIKNIVKYVFVYNYFVANIACEKSFLDLIKMTTSDMIREEGYQSEEHTVITEDGYILTMHRIPGKLKAPAVLIVHGLLANSFDYVVMGKNKSLAFLLADQGYDVWLGNSRGNTYSRRHVKLDPSQPRFWNFSFSEMGMYDLPAFVTYISDMKNDSLFYIGHSMGTTMSYVMAIERPDIAAKVKILLSLGPAVFVRYWTSPLRLIINSSFDFEGLADKLKLYELLPQNYLTRIFLKYYCNSLTENNPCLQVIFTILGRNLDQFDFKLLPKILSHTPAGSSTKTVLHYIQLSRSGKFQKYDYKRIGNKMKYNSTEPPEYDITKIKVPIGLFWSDNDLLVNPKDVEILYELIPQKALSYRIPDPLFTHTDFIWAKNAPEMVYFKLLSVMRNYL